MADPFLLLTVSSATTTSPTTSTLGGGHLGDGEEAHFSREPLLGRRRVSSFMFFRRADDEGIGRGPSTLY